MASTKGRTWEESREILAAATAMDLTGDKADEIYDKWADTYDEVGAMTIYSHSPEANLLGTFKDFL